MLLLCMNIKYYVTRNLGNPCILHITHAFLSIVDNHLNMFYILSGQFVPTDLSHDLLIFIIIYRNS